SQCCAVLIVVLSFPTRRSSDLIGFGDDYEHEDFEVGQLLQKVLPKDLLNYGLIPEFIGRLPVITSLEPLDEKTLIEILTAPKNAIVKQSIKPFQIDDVELEFEEEALREIAQDDIERKTGARGLRSIIENIMLDVMFELPSRDDIEKCIITKESVYSDEIGPKLIYTDGTF